LFRLSCLNCFILILSGFLTVLTQVPHDKFTNILNSKFCEINCIRKLENIWRITMME
jgi:hypothetical protein